MEGEVINRKHFPFWSLKMGTFSVPSFWRGVGGEASVFPLFTFFTLSPLHTKSDSSLNHPSSPNKSESIKSKFPP